MPSRWSKLINKRHNETYRSDAIERAPARTGAFFNKSNLFRFALTPEAVRLESTAGRTRSRLLLLNFHFLRAERRRRPNPATQSLRMAMSFAGRRPGSDCRNA